MDAQGIKIFMGYFNGGDYLMFSFLIKTTFALETKHKAGSDFLADQLGYFNFQL